MWEDPPPGVIPAIRDCHGGVKAASGPPLLLLRRHPERCLGGRPARVLHQLVEIFGEKQQLSHPLGSVLVVLHNPL
jgi:hypothetical protein